MVSALNALEIRSGQDGKSNADIGTSGLSLTARASRIAQLVGTMIVDGEFAGASTHI